MTYHHGHLREELIDAAVAAIERDGVDRLSLREVARTVGVSHAASAHHFGDRRGLLTAIATDGFTRLTTALESAEGGFVDAGVAYVRFAIADRGRFEVMFRPGLIDAHDVELRRAMGRAHALLAAGAARQPGDRTVNALAAWSIVHGFATLWNAGAIGAADQHDGTNTRARSIAGSDAIDEQDAGADELARAVAETLFAR